MGMYYKSVGRNSTLIMGLTPDPDGLLPEPDVKRLKEWGDEIKRRFDEPIAETSGKGKQITLTLKKAQEIDHIILQEDIHHGERVREFILKAKVDGKWKQLYEGSNIGHKHIVQIDPQKVSAVRLISTKYRLEPLIKTMQVFNVE